MPYLFCSGKESARLGGNFLEGAIHVRSADHCDSPGVNKRKLILYKILNKI